MDGHSRIAHNQLAMARRHPHSIAAVVTAALTGLLIAGAAIASPAAGAAAAPTGTRHVIVQAEPAAVAMARQAVHDVGGRVTRDLPIVNGFAATVPAATIARVAHAA